MKTEQTSGDMPEVGAAPRAIAKSNDELWGKMVIVVFGLGLVSMIGFFGFLGYQFYDQRSEEGPSIAEMPKNEESSTAPVTEAAPVAETQPAAETPATDAKQVAIAVLNGGGAGGSAGVLADALKQAGYTKTTAGNATGDYAGVTVFYGAGQESAAKTILTEVVKKYPKATVAPADPKKADTTGSAVVVVIGAGS